MNRIIIIGRLVRDIDLKTIGSGVSVANFCLAVDRKFKNAAGEKETDFIDIVVWRQQADLCAKYLSKGNMAAVDGSLQIRTYEAKDGSKRKVAEVVADNVQFLSPKGEGTPKQSEPKPFDEPNENLMGGDSDDDLPF